VPTAVFHVHLLQELLSLVPVDVVQTASAA